MNKKKSTVKISSDLIDNKCNTIVSEPGRICNVIIAFFVNVGNQVSDTIVLNGDESPPFNSPDLGNLVLKST